MSTTPLDPVRSNDKLSALTSTELGPTGRAIAWSSFFFVILQSICTLFVAVNGLRLLLGIGALAITAGFAANLDRFHNDWARVPMLVLALGGAVLNMAILIQIRMLRSRPSSQWRQLPMSKQKIRMERVQWVLSVATVVLVLVEEVLHLRIVGHL